MVGEKPGSALVRMTGISRRFAPDTWALRGVSLSLVRGESVALRGASGSGKTSLLSILGLLDHQTAGEFILDDADVSTLSESARTRERQAGLSFIFQAFHLVPHLTSLENVADGLRYARVPRADREERAVEALHAVGMMHRAHALPNTLSGGEQQRVAVARAIARSPKLILCDEPTGNLDSTNSRAVLECILNAAELGSCVVIATHDDDVASRCDHELVLSDGVVV